MFYVFPKLMVPWIGMEVRNLSMLPFVSDLVYRRCSVSDHSPLVVHLTVSLPVTLPKAPWKFNAFWSYFDPMMGWSGACAKVFTFQDPSTSCLQQWQTVEAYLRGLLITEINRVKHASLDQKVEVESRVLEQQYIADPSVSAKEALQTAQSAYQHLIILQTGVFWGGGKDWSPFGENCEFLPKIPWHKSKKVPGWSLSMLTWINYAGISQFLWIFLSSWYFLYPWRPWGLLTKYIFPWTHSNQEADVGWSTYHRRTPRGS